MTTVKSKPAQKNAPGKTPSIKKFDSTNLADLSTQLQQQFGFDGFKGPQEEIIQTLLSGRDAFVIMPTGGGKVYVTSFPQ